MTILPIQWIASSNPQNMVKLDGLRDLFFSLFHGKSHGKPMDASCRSSPFFTAQQPWMWHRKELVGRFGLATGLAKNDCRPEVTATVIRTSELQQNGVFNTILCKEICGWYKQSEWSVFLSWKDALSGVVNHLQCSSKWDCTNTRCEALFGYQTTEFSGGIKIWLICIFCGLSSHIGSKC